MLLIFSSSLSLSLSPKWASVIAISLSSGSTPDSSYCWSHRVSRTLQHSQAANDRYHPTLTCPNILYANILLVGGQCDPAACHHLNNNIIVSKYISSESLLCCVYTVAEINHHSISCSIAYLNYGVFHVVSNVILTHSITNFLFTQCEASERSFFFEVLSSNNCGSYNNTLRTWSLGRAL